ncbi:MAG TPA: helix-turn-helix domain-containing protein [Acetobacteraceae bacterium]|nr:helix-turn-helix domain-containing protein [Acetobacteraceae bacterium]
MSDKSRPRPGRPTNSTSPPSEVTDDVSACPQHVRQALAHLRQHFDERVTLAGLATAAGTSERTLRRNFPRFVGVAPLAYLRQLRLTAVRNELSRGEDSINRVAARHGFTHFGRFSIAYRECFGETPSATCRRARRDSQQLITGRDRGTTNEPCLIVTTSSMDGCGREMNLFADNLGEQLAASLAAVPLLAIRLVPARRDLSAPDRKFARYMLTARVMPEADLIRIVARLVATDDGRHLWGETFDGTLDKVLAFQTRIVATVLEATRSAVMTAEIQAAQNMPAEELRDRDLVLRALPFALSSDQSGRTLETLYRAIELYPDNGLAVALAAWCHAQSVTPWNKQADRDRSRALTLAERAGVLDPTDALVLTARAAVMTMAQDFDTADTLVQRALARDPRCYWAWERRGWLKALTRHSETAIADFEQALRLVGPQSDGASSLFGIGTAHWCHREYDAAMIWVDRAAARRPNAPGILAQLAGCHIRLGDGVRGRAILATMMRLRPEITAGHISEAFWFDKPCPSVANVLSQAGLTQ